MGKARISSSTRMSCTCRTEEKSARSRVECPMVKMVATIRFYWMKPHIHHGGTSQKKECHDHAGWRGSEKVWLQHGTPESLMHGKDYLQLLHQMHPLLLETAHRPI